MDFSHKESQRRWRRLRIKIYLIGFLICLLALGGFYLVKEAEFFRIEEIKVIGLEQEKQEKFLADLAAGVEINALTKLLSQDNYFFWPSEISLTDLEYKKVAIDKDFFGHKATVNIEKRERMGIWCYEQARINADQTPHQNKFGAGPAQINAEANPGDKFLLRDSASGLRNSASIAERCYWFDDEGTLFKDAPESEGQLLFKIDAQSENSKELGEKAVSHDLFQNIRKILNGVRELNLSVKSTAFKNELQELWIKSHESAEIKFSLRFDPEKSSLPALKKILETNQLSRVSYIDLTVENKVYLK